MLSSCRVDHDNPGLELGLELGRGWEAGRDKVVVPDANGFGLWLEQLIAESTGKDGKGLVPAPGERPDGPDRQAHDVEIADPYDVAAEFFRWEFATAVAGAILGINPFNQPNVQEAKDRTGQILTDQVRGTVPQTSPEGSVDELVAQAREGDYIAVQAFVDPQEEPRLHRLV